MSSRKKSFFSIEEEQALVWGYLKYNNEDNVWRLILNDPKIKHVFKSRSNVDLKDKYRNLKKRYGDNLKERLPEGDDWLEALNYSPSTSRSTKKRQVSTPRITRKRQVSTPRSTPTPNRKRRKETQRNTPQRAAAKVASESITKSFEGGRRSTPVSTPRRNPRRAATTSASKLKEVVESRGYYADHEGENILGAQEQEDDDDDGMNTVIIRPENTPLESITPVPKKKKSDTVFVKPDGTKVVTVNKQSFDSLIENFVRDFFNCNDNNSKVDQSISAKEVEQKTTTNNLGKNSTSINSSEEDIARKERKKQKIMSKASEKNSLTNDSSDSEERESILESPILRPPRRHTKQAPMRRRSPCKKTSIHKSPYLLDSFRSDDNEDSDDSPAKSKRVQEEEDNEAEKFSSVPFTQDDGTGKKGVNTYDSNDNSSVESKQPPAHTTPSGIISILRSSLGIK